MAHETWTFVYANFSVCNFPRSCDTSGTHLCAIYHRPNRNANGRFDSSASLFIFTLNVGLSTFSSLGCRSLFHVHLCFLSQKSKSPNEATQMREMKPETNEPIECFRFANNSISDEFACRWANFEHSRNLSALGLHAFRLIHSSQFIWKRFGIFVFFCHVLLALSKKRRQWFIRCNNFDVGILFHLPKRTSES